MLKATVSYTQTIAIADADLPKNWKEMSDDARYAWIVEQGLQSMKDVGVEESEIWNARAVLDYRPGRDASQGM